MIIISRWHGWVCACGGFGCISNDDDNELVTTLDESEKLLTEFFLRKLNKVNVISFVVSATLLLLLLLLLPALKKDLKRCTCLVRHCRNQRANQTFNLLQWTCGLIHKKEATFQNKKNHFSQTVDLELFKPYLRFSICYLIA